MLYRWASEMALHANVWRKSDAPPFKPEDFLDGSNREQRRIESSKQQLIKDAGVVGTFLSASKALAALGKGKTPTELIEEPPLDDSIPDWARGPYKGAN